MCVSKGKGKVKGMKHEGKLPTRIYKDFVYTL